MISLIALFLNVSSAFGVFGFLFSKFFPRLLFVECVAISIPIGITLSAWCGLLFKSLLPTGFGLSTVLVALCVVTHAGLAVAVWPPLRRALHSGPNRRILNTELSSKKLHGALLFVGIVWSWLAYLLHTHYLRREGRGYHTGGTTWADMPFHLNIMSSFIYGANGEGSVFRPLASVFYSNTTLAYPYLPDFHTALNVAAGSTLREALVIPGGLLLASFLLLLFSLGYRLSGSMSAACAAIPLTMFTGGTGAITLYNAGWNWDNFMKKDHVFHLVDGSDAFWFSLPAHILFPQRTTQFAYSLDVAILLLLFVAQAQIVKPKQAVEIPSDAIAAEAGSAKKDGTTDNAWSDDWVDFDAVKTASSSLSHRTVTGPSPAKPPAAAPRMPAAKRVEEVSNANMSLFELIGPISPQQKFALHLVAGFATGLLPLLQPHSFVSVGSVALGVAVCDLLHRIYVGMGRVMVDKRGSVFDANDWAGLWCWVGYGVIAFAVGLPQFIPFFGRVSSNHSFIRFVTVWSTMRSPGPVSLWFKALGLYVPLFALSAALLSRTRPTQWYFYVGFTVVFVEANFIIFQPWEMDNTKVFYIWVFGASVYITSLLRSFILLGRGRIFLIALLSLIAGATYITLTTSGVLCAVQETVSNSEMFDLVDVEYALWVRDNTPPDAVFMVPSEHYPRHFRVESALAGRAVLAGYAGWLSSHGLDYGKRYNDMNDMMVGAGDTYNWLLRYNVTHITVPWKLRRSFNVEYLNSIATRVTSNGRYTVFEVARDELTDPFKPCGGTNGAVFTNEKPCREAGCTWLPRFSGVKCQMPHGLASGERVNDCGSPGEQLTEDTCHDKWCGWFPNYKGPWCQSSSHRAAGGRHRKFEPMPILTPDYDCGWHGMDVQQCIDRGCTWTPAGSNPWCTYKGPNSKSADIINQIEPM